MTAACWTKTLSINSVSTKWFSLPAMVSFLSHKFTFLKASSKVDLSWSLMSSFSEFPRVSGLYFMHLFSAVFSNCYSLNWLLESSNPGRLSWIVCVPGRVLVSQGMLIPWVNKRSMAVHFSSKTPVTPKLSFL